MAMADSRNEKPGKGGPRQRGGWLAKIAPGVRGFARKRETPENLWVKCPDTGEMIYRSDLEAAQWVTPAGRHMRIGPEHSWLHDVGRAEYLTCTDEEALEAFKLCAELEGIIPALESAHAIARLPDVAREVGKDGIVVLTLSGRGDKDIFTVAQALGRKI